jgi:hypothetical protein
MDTKTLYHGLQNSWPENETVGYFKEPEDYFRVGSSIFITSNIKADTYNCKGYAIKVVNYARIPLHYSASEIVLLYPALTNWVTKQWPRSVGRYAMEEYVVDLVFGKRLLGDVKEKERLLREAPVDSKWTKEERDEWLDGFYGYWRSWTYDLRSASMAALIMKFVNELPDDQRTAHRIVRHVLSCSDQVNRPDGLMYGRWDGQYNDGKNPVMWNNSHELYTHRFEKAKPSRYTQCWIFSEMLTTAFRFLGIPARSVYASNAHIDRHRDGGIDLGLVMSKGDGSPKAARMGSKTVVSNLDAIISGIKANLGTKTFTISPLQIPQSGRVVRKGDSDGKLPIPSDVGKGRLERPNIPELVGAGDSSWNFHVWNEVYIVRPDLMAPYNALSWQCLDASPMVETDSKDDYAGKKMFGPCPTAALKMGIDLNHDFRYMYSAVNSLWRYWKQSTDDSIFIQESSDQKTQQKVDDKIYYISSISYSHLDRDRISSSDKVQVFTRDPKHSHGGYVIKKEITHNYTPDSPERAYNIHHALHPAMFEWNNRGLTCKPRTEKSESSKRTYYVQICYLNYSGCLLQCHRQISTFGTLKIPDTPAYTDRISTLIIDNDTRQWWPQVISLNE